jgi:hypothetical protein
MNHLLMSSSSPDGTVFPLLALSRQPETVSKSSIVAEPKTYTTQEVMDKLGLQNPARLHQAKNDNKPYLHESSRQSDLRVVLPIKRNTWMIFSPC